ncbi:abortive infection family protein [Isoptericola cucumis]|uniref:abortive infection family protein n=1 Tax=Isoptericola cucumis TaxID=1776856 RepID=UPI001667288C
MAGVGPRPGAPGRKGHHRRRIDQGCRRRARAQGWSLAQSVTELRNSVGIDHGAEEVLRWVCPRHARLVVGAAQVWCPLVLETLADPEAPWRRAES